MLVLCSNYNNRRLFFPFVSVHSGTNVHSCPSLLLFRTLRTCSEHFQNISFIEPLCSSLYRKYSLTFPSVSHIEPCCDHAEGGVYIGPEFQLGQVYDGTLGIEEGETLLLYRPVYACVKVPSNPVQSKPASSPNQIKDRKQIREGRNSVTDSSLSDKEVPRRSDGHRSNGKNTPDDSERKKRTTKVRDSKPELGKLERRKSSSSASTEKKWPHPHK